MEPPTFNFETASSFKTSIRKNPSNRRYLNKISHFSNLISYPERWQKRHVPLGNNSHTIIIKSLKNLDPDRTPTSRHAWTRFRHHVGSSRTAYQQHISGQRVLCTRHQVVLQPCHLSYFIPPSLLFKKFHFGNESQSMKVYSSLANAADLVSDGDRKR